MTRLHDFHNDKTPKNDGHRLHFDSGHKETMTMSSSGWFNGSVVKPSQKQKGVCNNVVVASRGHQHGQPYPTYQAYCFRGEYWSKPPVAAVILSSF